MPEETIHIGGKAFTVACQDGEEHFLQAAARMLDAEAQTLIGQIGRMPEARMLLMAGLMLADKTAAADDQRRVAEEKLAAAEAELARLRGAEPRRVEVPVVPNETVEALAELAARAEALADRIEDGQG